MKIVHLCQYYMMGHTYQENYLPKSMAKLGHAVTVIAGTKNPDFYNGPARAEGETVQDGPVRVRYTEIQYKSLFTPVPNLYALLEEEGPALVFVHGFILTRCPQLKKWADAHPEVIFAADTHETWVLAFNACFTNSLKDRVRRFVYFDCVYAWWRRYVEGRYKKVFYVTPPRKAYAMEAFGFSERILAPLWLGADFSTLPYENKGALRGEKRRSLGLDPEARLIIHPGKLDLKKHTGELISAFSRCLKEGLAKENWHLVLVGSLTPELEAQARAAAETTGRVHLTGLVSGEEVLNWIAAGDFAAYPGAHSVLWEQTAALGIPAIYYAPTPGDAEYLSDDSALFVRKGDEEEVYAALSTLLLLEKDLPEMGNRARALSEKQLDYDAQARDCLALLTEEG